MDIEVVILVIVLFIILVIVLSIVIIRLIFFTPSTEFFDNTSPGQLNYDCSVNPCADGLECDPQFRQCKLSDGESCTVRSDCLTQSYCNGTCIPRSTRYQAITGVTGDPCPCNYDTHSCVNGSCLSLNSCTTNMDCVTGSCLNGSCSALLNNGDPCASDIECLSGNCSNGTCQMRGLESGQIGSMCRVDEDCNSILVCRNESCRIP